MEPSLRADQPPSPHPAVERERAEHISVAAAAAAAAVGNPMAPRTDVHRSEPAAKPEASSFETEAFDNAGANTEAMAYERRLEDSDDRTTTEAFSSAPEHFAPARSAAAEQLIDRPRAGKLRFGRVLVVGVVSGLLVAAGLLAAEGIWGRFRNPDPSTVALHEQQFTALGFSIDVPRGWDVEPAGTNVLFIDPDRPDDRGIRVTRLDDSLEEVHREADASNRTRFSSYRLLRASSEDRVGGLAANIRDFIGNDLQYRQWIVEDGAGGSFLIESWFHPAEADEAHVLDERVVETFSLP